MTMYTDHLRPAQGHSRFALILGRAYALLGHGLARPRYDAAADLARLDDHLLRDIGLSRDDLPGIAQREREVADIEARRAMR